jgi:hypothetical protein
MDSLAQMTEKLQRAWEDQLVSVILYGSAASADSDRRSDFNLLCVLKEITARELEHGEGALKWWKQQGNPTPILLSQAELFRAADSFPIEYHDMQERRRVLYGPDLVADITVQDRFYRQQIEHELRANQLRLRLQAAPLLSDSAGLLRLCMDSLSTFLVLGRHALRFSGRPVAPVRREIITELERWAKVPSSPLLQLLDLREERIEPKDIHLELLFPEYLTAVERIIDYVDRLEP